MFCHITQNWRATPLTSRLAVVELIANTTTKTGLTIRCELDTNTYPKGIKVSEQFAELIDACRRLDGLDGAARALISLTIRR
jgi:hypothetical protein